MGRFASEPVGGRTSLNAFDPVMEANASVVLAGEYANTTAPVPGNAVQTQEMVPAEGADLRVAGGEVVGEETEGGTEIAGERPSALTAAARGRAGRSQADQGGGARARGSFAFARVLSF